MSVYAVFGEQSHHPRSLLAQARWIQSGTLFGVLGACLKKRAALSSGGTALSPALLVGCVTQAICASLRLGVNAVALQICTTPFFRQAITGQVGLGDELLKRPQRV